MPAKGAKQTRYDWPELEIQFMASNLPQDAFARSKGIPVSTLTKQAMERKWNEKRIESQRLSIQKANLKIVSRRTEAIVRHSRLGRLFQVKAGRAFIRRNLNDSEAVTVNQLADIANKGVAIEREALDFQTEKQLPGGLAFGAEVIEGVDGKTIRIMAQVIASSKASIREGGPASLAP